MHICSDGKERVGKIKAGLDVMCVCVYVCLSLGDRLIHTRFLLLEIHGRRLDGVSFSDANQHSCSHFL